jgi:TolB-like protein/tetratricopeptide (TPR) repeat protein
LSFFTELKRRNVFRMGIAYVVVVWVLLQAIDFGLDIISAPNWVMQVFFLAGVAGLPIVLIFAWVFEMTPEGIKRESGIDRSQSVTHSTGSKLDRTIITFLAFAVVLLLAERFISNEHDKGSDSISLESSQTLSGTAEEKLNLTSSSNLEQESSNVSDEPSVAVLPFVNMSSDPEQEYFSDGISEEILNVLTRIPNLKVAARTSSFQFKGKNLDIADIGKQLQVNHLLEGSVRKAGNTLRITAQLIETDTGFHLWSETYDRNPEDVFAIQDEIAAAIAVELRTLFSGEIETSSTPIDMQAYELYLKGRGLVAQRREVELFEGIDALDAAIKIEPEYAPAMATMAKAHAVLPWFSNRVPAGESRELARKWATRALEIEPENVEAMAVLGVVLLEVDLDPYGSLELLKKAVKLNPGSVAANNFLGDAYSRVGDFTNALKYESRAAELDPLGPVQLTDLGNVYMLTGDYERVIKLATRALALDPTFLSSYQHLADVNFILGNLEQHKRTLSEFSSIPDVWQSRVEGVKIQLLLAEGTHAAAKKLIAQRASLAKAGKRPAADVAFDAVLAGDFDTAGDMLLQAYRNNDGTWLYPLWIRLPEQAPDSGPWQEFWSQPALKDLIELRRKNGLSPEAPTFGSGAKP